MSKAYELNMESAGGDILDKKYGNRTELAKAIIEGEDNGFLIKMLKHNGTDMTEEQINEILAEYGAQEVPAEPRYEILFTRGEEKMSYPSEDPVEAWNEYKKLMAEGVDLEMIFINGKEASVKDLEALAGPQPEDGVLTTKVKPERVGEGSNTYCVIHENGDIEIIRGRTPEETVKAYGDEKVRVVMMANLWVWSN